MKLIKKMSVRNSTESDRMEMRWRDGYNILYARMMRMREGEGADSALRRGYAEKQTFCYFGDEGRRWAVIFSRRSELPGL